MRISVLNGLRMAKGIGNIRAAPAGAGLRHLKIAAGSRTATLNGDAGSTDAKHFAGLMLGENAGDVIVDYDDFVHFAEPCCANMPIVAEPQPTRMRSSRAPLTTGSFSGGDRDDGTFIDGQRVLPCRCKGREEFHR